MAGIPKPGSDTELVGRKFNRLTVIRLAYRKSGARYWLCRCECGTEKVIRQWEFTKGSTYSCGCLQREIEHTKLMQQANTVHGHSGKVQSRTYVTWNKMKQRCLNPNNDSYDRYGGRGIKICERWLVFENFLADMGERPAGMSLDRYPDTNGNYEPSNCRWATQRQQSNNMRKNVRVEFQGERLTVAELAARIGMPTPAVRGRIDLGWPIDRIISTPVKKYNRKTRAFNAEDHTY